MILGRGTSSNTTRAFHTIPCYDPEKEIETQGYRYFGSKILPYGDYLLTCGTIRNIIQNLTTIVST